MDKYKKSKDHTIKNYINMMIEEVSSLLMSNKNPRKDVVVHVAGHFGVFLDSLDLSLVCYSDSVSSEVSMDLISMPI